METFQALLGERQPAVVEQVNDVQLQLARLRGLRGLTNEQLSQRLRSLATQKQALDAELLLYLSELDRRRLYREQACASLFEFCVSRLGYSEDVAYKRVGAARMLQTYPVVFELLSDGRIHLSALMLLRPHLTQENHRDWLSAAAGKSKREVERLVATRCPKPDVVTQVRRLPVVASRPAQVEPISIAVGKGSLANANVLGTLDTSAANNSRGPTVRVAPLNAELAEHQTTIPKGVAPALRPKFASKAKVQPISEHSYRVVFTASERLKQKLERATELTSHVVSPADLPALIERALDLLIERTERRRYGSKSARTVGRTLARTSVKGVVFAPVGTTSDSTTLAPVSDAVVVSGDVVLGSSGDNGIQSVGRASVLVSASVSNVLVPDPACDIEEERRRSRYVPAAVRRVVWERDGGRCTYIDCEGHRCEQRHFVQLDHRASHALGGAPTETNLRLVCAAHNTLYAEQVYGSERVLAAIAWAHERR